MMATGVRTASSRMASELAILLEANRKRRQHGEALFRELSEDLAVRIPEPPKPRKVPAPGYREIGMARFRNVRVASANRI